MGRSKSHIQPTAARKRPVDARRSARSERERWAWWRDRQRSPGAVVQGQGEGS